MKQIDIDRALKVGGWMSPACLKWLAEQVSECERVVELGTFRGRSAVAILDNSDAHLWCVDTWNYKICTEKTLRIFEHNIIGQEDRVTIMQMTTHKAARELAGKQFDMVFLDAAHAYHMVKQDILDWLPLVKSGGLLCGHDYGTKSVGVAQAVDELISHFEVYESIWWRRM